MSRKHEQKEKRIANISCHNIIILKKVVRFNAVFANNRYKIKKKKGSRLLLKKQLKQYIWQQLYQ